MCNHTIKNPNEGEPLLRELLVGPKASPGLPALELRDQLKSYWQRSGVFICNHDRNCNDPLQWWKALAKHSDARMLSVSSMFNSLMDIILTSRTVSSM